jgi:cytochrome c oxidase subunit 1
LIRTLFSWTLHAIVYFWLIPAYIALYSFVPKAAGGKLFSDELARVSLIMLIVISVPIGMHHLYMDPFQGAGWKFLHMIGTLMVALPTMFTGFTVIASMEVAGRMNGGKGLFGWMKKLPWDNPMVLAGGLSLLMLTFGGFGGLINASYAMNSLVHNTQWITGHFHLIFAGTTVIMYFAIAYYIWPQLTGRALKSIKLVRMQLWLWFWGMLVLTLPWHWIGMLGQPRRISSTPYDSPLVARWDSGEIGMILGGVLLFASAVLLMYNLIASSGAEKTTGRTDSIYAEALHPVLKLPAVLNGFGFWSIVIAIYLVVSYGYPIFQFFVIGTHGSPTFGV